jgi:hypothetical protein
MQLAVPSLAEPLHSGFGAVSFQSGRSSCGECFGVTQLHHVDFYWEESDRCVSHFRGNYVTFTGIDAAFTTPNRKVAAWRKNWLEH